MSAGGQELGSLGFQWVIPDRFRASAILEDSQDQRRSLRTNLENREFIVLSPSSDEECVRLLDDGCAIFILDASLDCDGRQLQGLRALESIKRKHPSAFCAVITNRPDRVRCQEIAKRLGADWFSGKTPAEIEALIGRIEEEFLRRCFGLGDGSGTGELTKEALGKHLRQAAQGTLEAFSDAVNQVREGMSCAVEALKRGDQSASEQELVSLEPLIRAILRCHRRIGDGFGMVVSALLNSLINISQTGFSEEKLTSWSKVFDCVVSVQTLSSESAASLVDELEDAGLNPDPPGYEMLTTLLDLALRNGLSDE